MSSAIITKVFWKRWILLYACSFGVALLLLFGFIRGFLSPRERGIAMLLWAIATVTGVVLVVKRTAKEIQTSPRPPGAPIDDATRKLLLRRIRRAKTTIILMCVVLVLALIQIRHLPMAALLVGIALNLLTTAHEARTTIRLKKILA